ncbi:MAG: PfkB family carbohydrate kinase, partial [Pseudomonadota bacterium]
GHAIILVDDAGENQILIESAANRELTEAQVKAALSNGQSSGNWVLLQNETNLAEFIVAEAKQAGFGIAYAAAPFVAETTIALLPQIDFLAVNEGEAAALATTMGIGPQSIPVPRLLITKGAEGSWFRENDAVFEQFAFPVEAVDTVGAGDTFLGSFLSEHDAGKDAAHSLRYAAAASAVQVTKPGAATAIPDREKVEKFLEQRKSA